MGGGGQEPWNNQGRDAKGSATLVPCFHFIPTHFRKREDLEICDKHSIANHINQSLAVLAFK